MNESFTVDWIIKYLSKSGCNSKKTVLDRFKKMNPKESFDLENSLVERRQNMLKNKNKCPIEKFIKGRI